MSKFFLFISLAKIRRKIESCIICMLTFANQTRKMEENDGLALGSYEKSFYLCNAEIKKTMKKIIIMIVAGMLLAACQESLEERCAREAKEYTQKNCPRHIDTEIVLDSMTFDKDSHTIGYCYTLQGSLDNPLRVDSAQFSEALLLEVKNSTNLKLYKDAGYSFRYTYHSEKDSGTKLFEATFRENDYR